MKCWTRFSLSLLALSLFFPEVRADLAPRPGLRPPIRPGVGPIIQPGAGRPMPTKVKLVVRVDEKAKLPVLQVPLNLALGQQPVGGAGAALPPQGANVGQRLSVPTVVAGLALTLAFASGGLWLMRRRSGRYLAILVVLSLFAAGTAAVWADFYPGPGPRVRPPAAPVLPALKLPAGIELTDKLILEPLVAADDHLTLIVPKSMVADKEKIETSAKRPR